MTEITDTQLEHWAAHAEPISRITAEPQGEPSDAEHQVAWAEYRKDFQPNIAHLHREAIAFREGWRAALRAAGGAR